MQVLCGHCCPNQNSGKDKEEEGKGQGRVLMPAAVPANDLAAT